MARMGARSKMDGPMVVATVAQGGGGIDVLEPGGSVAVLP